MRLRRRIFALLVILSLLLSPMPAQAQTPTPEPEQPAPQSLEALEQRLNVVLSETGTPGMIVSVVEGGEIVWTAGLGVADTAANTPVTAETRFRIGSISKMFAGIAALQLVERGQIRLDDRVLELAPELGIQNAWEETNPLLVVHILEHTAGFDDISPREYTISAPDITLEEALALNRSRTSRWPPGAYFSYSNIDPPVLAYILERLTGERFEDYVQANIFDPLDMPSTSYFLPEALARRTAKSYAGANEVPYSHIGLRSSGSAGATAGDMAHVVQMLLGRGTYQGQVLLSPASVERMETPSSTPAAQDGILSGYGIYNFTTIQDGFLWHGHNGGIDGFLSQLVYLPEHNRGYFFSINAGSGAAMEQAAQALSGYLTRDLTPPAGPEPVALTETHNLAAYAGWYEPVAPRVQVLYFIERPLNILQIQAGSDRLKLGSPLAPAINFELLALGEGRFRSDQAPVATTLIWPDPAGGYLLAASDAEFDGNYHSVPAWVAVGRLLLIAAVVVLLLSVILFAVGWVPVLLIRWLLRRLPEQKQYLSLRLLPLLAGLSLIGALAVLLSGMPVVTENGGPSTGGVLYLVLSLLFAGLTVLAVVWVVRAFRWPVNRLVHIHSLLVTLALVLALAYLGLNGMIGTMLWRL